jgi:hypothetical protein
LYYNKDMDGDSNSAPAIINDALADPRVEEAARLIEEITELEARNPATAQGVVELFYEDESWANRLAMLVDKNPELMTRFIDAYQNNPKMALAMLAHWRTLIEEGYGRYIAYDDTTEAIIAQDEQILELQSKLKHPAGRETPEQIRNKIVARRFLILEELKQAA